MIRKEEDFERLEAENERLTVELANAVEAVRQAEASKKDLADALEWMMDFDEPPLEAWDHARAALDAAGR